MKKLKKLPLMYSFLLGSLGGIVASLSFPPFNFPYLVWFFPMFLYQVYSSRGSIRFALVGWALIFSIFNLSRLPFDTFIILSVSFVFQVFIFALILSKVLKNKYAPSFYVLFPLMWVIFEFLQDRGFLGIPLYPLKCLSVPWLSIGVVLYSHPLRYIASVLGVWGLSLVILIVSGVLHQLLSSKRFVLFSIAVSALISMNFFPKPGYESGAGIKVGLIQPCVREDEARFPGVALSRSFRLSISSLPQNSLNVVVWPLHYLDSKLTCGSFSEYISNFAKEYRCYVIVGFSEDKISIYSLDGQEIGNVKCSFMLPRWKHLFKSYSSRTIEIVKTGIFNLAVVMDTDIGRSFLVRNLAIAGADLTVSITSDFLSGILQANAIVRALETGLYLAFSNNSGPSMLISPNGGVLVTPPFEEAVLSGEAPKRSSKTIFVKWGYYWIILLPALLLIDYFLKLRYSRSYTL